MGLAWKAWFKKTGIKNRLTVWQVIVYRGVYGVVSEEEKERVLESNEAKDVVVWLSSRRGQLVSLAENQVIPG